MGLTEGTLVAPQPEGVIDPRTNKPVGADDPFMLEVNAELAGQGLPRHHGFAADHLGPHGLADVDADGPRLLRRRDDPDVDAALRHRAIRHRAARFAAPGRRA